VQLHNVERLLAERKIPEHADAAGLRGVQQECGVVRPKRIKQWTFYKRDEQRIAALKRDIARRL
jgi:hypothetical protein